MHVGTIVGYRLTMQDAKAIQDARAADPNRMGNSPYGGEVVPLVVTMVHGPQLINGKLLLDGNDCHWVRDVSRGSGEGDWVPFEE